MISQTGLFIKRVSFSWRLWRCGFWVNLSCPSAHITVPPRLHLLAAASLQPFRLCRVLAWSDSFPWVSRRILELQMQIAPSARAFLEVLMISNDSNAWFLFYDMSVIEGLLFLTEYWPFSRSAQETVVARFPIFKAGSEPLYWEQRARCLNRLASLQVIATCYGNILFYIYLSLSRSLSKEV